MVHYMVNENWIFAKASQGYSDIIWLVASGYQSETYPLPGGQKSEGLVQVSEVHFGQNVN